MTSVGAPPGRYGTTDTPARRRRRVLAVVALAVAVVALVSWLALHHPGGPTVTYQTFGYSNAGPESVDVTFDVDVDPGTAVVCTLDAQNEQHAQVGSRDVTLPASDARTNRYTETVRTTETAVTALVDSCRAAG